MLIDTVCGYCGVGCGLTLTVEAGAVTKSTGNKAHPANGGRLCTKGNTTADLLRAGGRQTRAQLRATRDQPRIDADLHETVTETARRVRHIIDTHGPDAVALYVSGQMTLEAQYLATKLAKGFIRTQWIESNSRLCMASAGTGYKQSLGADGPPGSYDDIDNADVFLVLGSNMADCHPILFLRMMDRVKAGAKLIVVDPRRTATAAKAHLHLPINPGTDLALLNGLLALLVERGAIDDEFITSYTDGWEAMPEFLADYPLNRVADVTGLKPRDIDCAATLIAESSNWMSLWTMGLNQSTHGTWNTVALCNLHLATGAICRSGSGPFSLTGQPNAMGGREMGYMGPGLPGQRSVLNDDDRAHVEFLWGLPSGSIRAQAGNGTVDMFAAMTSGSIRAAWIICTNPVASMANRSAVIDALQTAELVVVQDAYRDTETSAYADVVLPAALWAETDGVMVNSERTLTRTAQATSPPEDALPDWQLIAMIAAELGYGDHFTYSNAAEIFDEITQFHNKQTGWDIRGVDHDRLKREPVQWPAPPGAKARNPIRYRRDDGTIRFATSHGRANFLPRPYLPPAELPDDDYPLVLTTGRLAHQWHTMTKTGRVAKLNRLNPQPFVQLNPDDAARLGITEGTPVRVSSRRGGATLPASIDSAVRPGVCFSPMHFADNFAPEVAINTVTNDAVDPESLQPEFKVSAVALTPVPTEDELSESSYDSPLAEALSPYAAGPGDLSNDAASYIGGLLTGWHATAPTEIPTIPDSAPLTSTARAWLDGVLAGVFGSTTTTEQAIDTQRAITIVWASQTGTAEEYAASCSTVFADSGFTPALASAEMVSPAHLTGDVVFIVATTGDGDSPDNGIALWDALATTQVGDLNGLNFSVLGFGDRSYADFCGFARRLDSRLEILGGNRIADLATCDPDYADTASAWLSAVFTALDHESNDPTPQIAPTDRPADEHYSRKNPYRTTITSTTLLSGSQSDKDVRTFTFALRDKELTYRAGDALGVWPRNSQAVVDEFCFYTGIDGSQYDLDRLDITRITPEILHFVSTRSAHPAELRDVIDSPNSFAEWSWGRQICDLLAAHPITAAPDHWADLIRPLTPRLYSISSSPQENPHEVSITTSVVRFDHRGASRSGVCSSFLASLTDDAEVDVFVQPTRSFLPPDDAEVPAIMIGPGTGVAPFRGFLHERSHAGHSGENWLFFGEQHEATDFYYRDEFYAMRDRGVLTRLDTAFSRDGDGKVYVQQRMMQHAAELWQWIRRGACIYVCGDATRMARDVDDALLSIVAEQGQMAPASAQAYITALRAEGRYVRDVY